MALAMKTLDRSLFSNSLKLAAATVNDNRNISKYRSLLNMSHEMWPGAARAHPIRPHPDAALAAQGKKCILLRSGVKVDGIALAILLSPE
jgi:tRNA (guanine37-N1)-methyltransferase